MPGTQLTKDILPEKFLDYIASNPDKEKQMRENKDGFGTSCFRIAEMGAAERFKLGMIEITRGVIWLEVIRTYDLWKFGDYKNWEHFLSNWIDQGAKERTRTRDWLKTTRLWMKGVHRQLADLTRYAEGVATIEPLFSPDDGIIKSYDDGGYNPRTGEIYELKPEWSSRLEGSTPEDQINAFIDEIPLEATRSSTTDSLRDTIPTAKWENYPIWKDGLCVGITTHFYDADGKLVKEVSTVNEEVWEIARSLGLDNKLLSMYGVPRDWRHG